MANRWSSGALVLTLLAGLAGFVGVGCDGEGQDKGQAKNTQEPARLVFHPTEVAGLSVAADRPDSIACEELDLQPDLGMPVTVLSPLVSIEPENGQSPKGIRFDLPEDYKPEDPSRLALAFYTMGFSQSTKRASTDWHVHTARYDPETHSVTARVGHASVWVVIDPETKLRRKVESDRFRIHYWSQQSSDEFVLSVHSALVESRRKLEAMGLSFGWKQGELLDIYLDPIAAGNRGVVYAEHRLGKSGGRFITVNLPSEIPGFSQQELRVTLAHELFHELQYRYENISTFQDVWLTGAQKLSTSWLNPAGKLANAIYPLEKYDYPLGWLNEALSTWFQLDFDPNWTPARDDPMYGNVQDFLTGGLGGLKTDNGYGGAVFIDYMVRRCGREFIRELMLAVKRQGRNRNALAAIKEAALKIAVARQDPDLATFDPLWSEFSTALLLDDTKLFDRRINRRQTIASRNQAQNVAVAGAPEGAVVQLDVSIAPLSMLVSGFRIWPAKAPEGDATIVCRMAQEFPEEAPFAVWTSPIGSVSKLGNRAMVPAGGRFASALKDSGAKTTLRIPLPAGQREATLRLVTVGVWDGKAPQAADRVLAQYVLSFQIVPDETEEDDQDDGQPDPPIDNVVTGVYYGQLQSNTSRSGEMLWVVDAQERFVLNRACEVLSEQKDEFGRVTQTTFRFRKGFGSPPIPPGRYRICAGPRAGTYYARSKPFTLGRNSKVRVVVGTPPKTGSDD